MAQLNFPANPEVGDKYEPTDSNVIYTWNGVVWEATVPVNAEGAFVPLSGDVAMTGNLKTTGVLCNNTGNATVLLDLQRATATQFSITAEPNININSPCDILLSDAAGEALRIMQGTDEYMRFNTSTQTIITKNGLEVDGPLNIDGAVDCSGNVTFSDAQSIVVPDNQGFALRVGSADDNGAFGSEYVRFKTTDGSEEIDFSKKVKIDGQIDINSDVNILQPGSGQVDINIPDADGNAFRIMSNSELFRFNTAVTPYLADFTSAVQFDGALAINNNVTLLKDVNVNLIPGSSNALDFLSDGDFALRINTSAEQLITDYDIYNDNNDSVIGLGGTIAAPQLKIQPGQITGTGMIQLKTSSSTMPLVFGSNTSYTFLAPNSTTAMTRFVVQSTGDNTINIPNKGGTLALTSDITGGGVTFEGPTNCNDTAPTASPGDFYVNTVATGVDGADDSWTGIAGDDVLLNQFVFYVGDTGSGSPGWILGGVTDGTQFVTLGTTQTISGDKTFSSGIGISGGDAATVVNGIRKSGASVRTVVNSVDMVMASTSQTAFNGNVVIGNQGLNLTQGNGLAVKPDMVFSNTDASVVMVNPQTIEGTYNKLSLITARTQSTAAFTCEEYIGLEVQSPQAASSMTKADGTSTPLSGVKTSINGSTNLNIYAAGSAPSFFQGDTLVGGTAAAPNITLSSTGSAAFALGVEVEGGSINNVKSGIYYATSNDAIGLAAELYDTDGNPQGSGNSQLYLTDKPGVNTSKIQSRGTLSIVSNENNVFVNAANKFTATATGNIELNSTALSIVKGTNVSFGGTPSESVGGSGYHVLQQPQWNISERAQGDTQLCYFSYPRFENSTDFDETDELTYHNEVEIFRASINFTGTPDPDTDNPSIKTKTGFSVPIGFGDNTWESGTASEATTIGFSSNVQTIPSQNCFNFYAPGSAPNYFAGRLTIGPNTLTEGWVNGYTGGTRIANGSAQFNLNLNDNADSPCLTLKRTGNSYPMKIIDFWNADDNIGDISVSENKNILIGGTPEIGNLTFDGSKITSGAAINICAGGTGTVNLKTKNTNSLYRFYTADGSHYASFNFASLTGNKTYTYPNGGGTVALTSDLDNLVTTDTDETITGKKTFNNANGTVLGDLTLAGKTITSTGAINLQCSGNNTSINFKTKATNNNYNFYENTGAHYAKLLFPVTAQREITFQDKSGTVAFTSDTVSTDTAQTVTGKKTFSNTNGTVFDNGSGSGMTLKGNSITSMANFNIVAGGTGSVVFKTKNANSIYQFYHKNNTNYASFNFSALTGNKTITWPNKGGTVAFTSDISGGSDLQSVTDAGNETTNSIITNDSFEVQPTTSPSGAYGALEYSGTSSTSDGIQLSSFKNQGAPTMFAKGCTIKVGVDSDPGDGAGGDIVFCTATNIFDGDASNVSLRVASDGSLNVGGPNDGSDPAFTVSKLGEIDALTLNAQHVTCDHNNTDSSSTFFTALLSSTPTTNSGWTGYSANIGNNVTVTGGVIRAFSADPGIARSADDAIEAVGFFTNLGKVMNPDGQGAELNYQFMGAGGAGSYFGGNMYVGGFTNSPNNTIDAAGGATFGGKVTFQNLTINGTSLTSTGGLNLVAGGTGTVNFKSKNANSVYRFYHVNNTNYSSFNFNSYTGNRTVTWPNKGGTVAFTDDITNLKNALTAEVTAATDYASLKAAILTALASV